MARVFTISFEYRGSTHTALITQVDGSLTIRVVDDALHSILPDGEVVYNMKQGLQIDPVTLTTAQDLMIAILSTIEEKGVLPRNSSLTRPGREF